MSSGGSNKKNLSTAGLKYFDSFTINKTHQEKSKIDLCINSVKHTVFLSKVSNNYGGRNRIYFICPRCKTRVRLLYISGRYLFCRHCTKMSYPSQRRGHRTRQNQQLTLLYRKLKAENNYNCMSESLPSCPANMPQKTYVDIIKRIHALQNQRREEVFKKALVLLAKHDHNFMKCFNGVNMKSLSKFISSGAFNKKPQYADIEIINNKASKFTNCKNKK